MVGLNLSYTPAVNLQEAFIDDSTGAPLAAGIITFYIDTNRTVKKTVYEISGTPPSYIYSPLPNPLILSAVGTVVDGSGNDVLIYYYPYDTLGNIELYYITVEDSGNITQFTREGFPNVGGSSGPAGVGFYANYVPNSQFLMHNIVENTTTANVITQAITKIAQGGWTFERPNTSTATDLVEFDTFGYTANPPGDPRFAVRIINQIPNPGDTFKDLRLKFEDVNKFESGAQTYTFSFWAQSNGAGSVAVELLLIKNFGTGGTPSATTETPIVTFNILNSSYLPYQSSFTIGTNSGKSIGTNNDDFIQFALRFPVASTFDVSSTDYSFNLGTLSVSTFQDVTDADSRARGIAGWMPTPNPDGSDLYLPLRLTAQGLEFDHTVIGKIQQAVNSIPLAGVGELLCDGSQYKTTGYSSDGIPYSRLQAVLWNGFIQTPIYGTGPQFLTSYLENLNTSMLVTVNTAGTITAASNGTPSPTFTFNQVHDGTHPFVNVFTGHYVSSAAINFLYVLNSVQGTVTAATDAGGTGFTIIQERNNDSLRALVTVETVAAPGLDSAYWYISSTTVDYYMWFKVDGVGTDPAIGGRTGIEVDLLSTHSAADVAAIVAMAITGLHIDNIIMVAGSAIPAGSYFNLATGSINYYVWYTVNGAGTDPAPANKTGIKVAILSTDIVDVVVIKTQYAINQYAFAVPDFRGVFLRGYDPNANWDLFNNHRWAYPYDLSGPNMGTFEFDQILQHQHTSTTLINPLDVPSDGSTYHGTLGVIETGATGGSETRPINAYVNFVIKY